MNVIAEQTLGPRVGDVMASKWRSLRSNMVIMKLHAANCEHFPHVQIRHTFVISYKLPAALHSCVGRPQETIQMRVMHTLVHVTRCEIHFVSSSLRVAHCALCIPFNDLHLISFPVCAAFPSPQASLDSVGVHYPPTGAPSTFTPTNTAYPWRTAPSTGTSSE